MKSREDLQAEAVKLVTREKQAWEVAAAFVTEKVYFQMRNLIRTLRKNYWGVFDEPLDPITGRKKIWIPLTEWIVETVVKNIDLDTKDINFRAKNKKAIPFTSLVRSVVRNCLEYMNFGEKLDEGERQLAIDGTMVWSTEEVEKKPYTCNVDLLNFYIDPTAHSIAETGSVIERIVLSKPDFDKLARDNKWINREEAIGSKNINHTDGEFQFNNIDNTGNTPYVEIFRRRGWMPEYLMTGKEEDTDMIPGEIVVSRNGGAWLLHNIVKRKDNKNKGYEEAWYTRVPGRWYGRGAAEKVMMLQLWINIINNVRINKGLVAQLHLWKIRQGSGITPQMISRLGANGAILVQNMADIEQLVQQDVSNGAAQDEQTILQWARMVTSAWESVTGEGMPSTTATTSALSSRAANSSFELIKEGMGMFLARWLRNQSMPIIFDNLTLGEVIRYYPDDVQAYDEYTVNKILAEQLNMINQAQLPVDPMQVIMEQQRAIASLSAQGETRTMTYDEAVDITEYDVEILVTNETVDTGVLQQNLLTALQAAPEYRQVILGELFDRMGLKVPPLPQMQPQMQPPTKMGEQNPQEQMTQANTGEAFGRAQANVRYATGR